MLVERFPRLVGVPPMLYQKHWRLQLAAGRISSSPVKVATIAAEAAYGSGAAFSRAVSQETGVSPVARPPGRQ